MASAIDRAFELARSGQYRSVSEIIRHLRPEDRAAVEAHLANHEARREMILTQSCLRLLARYSGRMRRALVFSLLSLALAASCSAKHAEANTREQVISNVHLIIKSWDKDGDGKLSRSEVQAMVDEGFRRMAQGVKDGQPHPELETQRQEMLALYASQDTNHDGYLTFDELSKGPLATFDCMDANHDGKLSEEEIFRGMERCPSANLDAFAAKH